MGLILETLVIYRFYIIYIFYNPYLLLIIIIIPSPPSNLPLFKGLKERLSPQQMLISGSIILKMMIMGIMPKIERLNLDWVKVPVNHRAVDSGGFWIQAVSNRAHKKPDRTSTIGLFVWKKSPELIYGDNRAFPQRFFWYQAATDGTHDSKCGKISSHRF